MSDEFGNDVAKKLSGSFTSIAGVGGGMAELVSDFLLLQLIKELRS